ncbi:platelet glycoprotein Ib beta chain [Lonchura striata]
MHTLLHWLDCLETFLLCCKASKKARLNYSELSRLQWRTPNYLTLETLPQNKTTKDLGCGVSPRVHGVWSPPHPVSPGKCLQVKMNSGILLSLLGFLPLVTPLCPVPCKCTTNITDCSLKNLTVENLPSAFHPSVEIIHLASNRLTSIPNGLFDNLRSLQVVYLQGNPWECTCDILYLRSWLQWQQNRSLYRDVRCSSPEHLRGRIIAYLTEDEIVSTCQHWYCSLALLSQFSLFILLFLQGILVILIIVYLQKFRRMIAEARSTTRELD